ncbi:MAG: hypothetical protein ACI4A5_06300 [Hominilimicola sp.]
MNKTNGANSITKDHHVLYATPNVAAIPTHINCIANNDNIAICKKLTPLSVFRKNLMTSLLSLLLDDAYTTSHPVYNGDGT